MQVLSKPKLFAMLFSIFFLITYPPIYVYLKRGIEGIFFFLTGDAFLYLTIARNFQLGFFTFDQVTPTNGFNPLWQYYLSFMFRLFDLNSDKAELHFIFFSSILFVAIGACLVAFAIFKFTKSYLLSLFVIPGIYYLLIGSNFFNQSIWSYIDGMEGAFSIFFGGIIILAFANLYIKLADEKDPNAFSRYSELKWIGFALPFLILTRLDDFFILPALIIAVLFSKIDYKDKQKTLNIFIIPSFITILIYILYNKFTVGVFLPISGASKEGFAFLENTYVFLASLFPPIIDLKNYLFNKQSEGYFIFLNSFRYIQVFIPILLSIFYLYFVSKKHMNNTWYILTTAFSFYVLFKNSYNLLFVHLWHQGPWYYGFIQIVFCFMFISLIKDIFVDKLYKYSYLGVFVLFYFCLVASIVSAKFAFKAFEPENKNYLFWASRDEIVKHLKEKVQDPKLVEFGDGIVSFALRLPTIHGFQFAGDRESYVQKNEGNFLEHCYKRGYNILTSFEYLPMKSELESSEDILNFLKNSFLEKTVNDELDKFKYTLIYLDPIYNSPFILFEPK